MVDSTVVYTEYEDRQFQYRCRQFYCGVPPNERQLKESVLQKLAQKIMDCRTFSPDVIAPFLDSKKMLTYDELYRVTNPHTPPQKRAQELYFILRSKGEQVTTTVKFYSCLLQSSENFPPHYNLAQELRQWALVLSGVKKPILADETITGVSAMQVLDRMIEKLQGTTILKEDAIKLCKSLNLPGDTIPSEHTDLAILCQQWKQKVDSNCSPVSLVEIMMYTKGIGRHVSGLFCPSNHPVVEHFLVSLNQLWVYIPKYMGFSQDELKSTQSESVLQCVQGFLEVWEMPDCGGKTLLILQQAARLAEIPARCGPYLPGTMEIARPADLKRPEALPPMKALTGESGMFKGMEHGGLHVHVHANFKSLEDAPGIPTTLSWNILLRVCHDKQDGQEESGYQSLKTHPAQPHGGQPPTTAEHAEPTESLHTRKEQGTPIRDDNHPLIQGCKCPGSLERLKELLRQYSTSDIQSNDGAHPIHLAVMCESLDMVKAIAESNCNINAVTDNHCTPLMIACQKCNIHIVKYLMKCGVSITEKDCNGYSCLHYKETLENLDILTLIVGEGGGSTQCDIPTDGDQLTPLTRACLLGGKAYQAAEYLLTRNANVNGVANAQIHPLTAAAASGCEDLVMLLLDNGAIVDLQDRDGSTAILRACQRMHIRIVQILLDAHANVNTPDELGSTTVISAVENGSANLLTLLLKHNPQLDHPKGVRSGTMNPNRPDICEITPVSLACAQGRLDMVELLLEKGANINYVNERTLTALSFAVYGSHTHVIEFILKQNQLQKGISELKESLILAVKIGNIYLANLILTHMGGSEKVLNAASAEGYNELARHVRLLNEMRKGGCQEEEHAAEGKPQFLRDDAERSIGYVLEDFTQISIASLARVAGQEYILEEARKSNHIHILVFYEQYFADPRAIRDLFEKFVELKPALSPARFLFDLPKYDMKAFADSLLEMGRERLLEEVELALLAFPFTESEKLNGEGVFSLLFGPKFWNAVTKVGLPTATSPGVEPYGVKSCNQSDLDQSETGSRVHVKELRGPTAFQPEVTAQGEMYETTPHSRQCLPQPQSSPETTVPPARRSHSEGSEQETETTMEQETETAMYIKGIPVSRNPSKFTRQTSVPPLRGERKPTAGLSKAHKSSSCTPKPSGISPASKPPAIEAQEAQTSTAVPMPLEEHHSTADALHSDPAEIYRSDGPSKLSSQNRGHGDGSPQNTTHPAEDSTPVQRTQTVYFSNHSDQQPNATLPHTQSQDHTGQHPSPHSTESPHSEVPRPSLHRMDSAYHSHDGEFCTEYSVRLPSDTSIEERLCKNALLRGYKKVTMKITLGSISIREFKLEEGDDSFINTLRLIYDGSTENIHISLAFSV